HHLPRCHFAVKSHEWLTFLAVSGYFRIRSLFGKIKTACRERLAPCPTWCATLMTSVGCADPARGEVASCTAPGSREAQNLSRHTPGVGYSASSRFVDVRAVVPAKLPPLSPLQLGGPPSMGHFRLDPEASLVDFFYWS